MAFDSGDNVYLSGYIGASAYGQSYNGGSKDAIIYKISTQGPSGSLEWARFWGGSGVDYGTGGMNGQIVICFPFCY